MSGFIKDDLTVALDEVDRAGKRLLTIYRDLAGVASEPALADDLASHAERLQSDLARYDEARRRHQQIPEQEDPELGHLQALWLTVKSALAAGEGEQALRESLQPLCDHLADAIEQASALGLPGDVRDALDALKEHAAS